MDPRWLLLLPVGIFLLDFWATTHLRSIAATYGMRSELEREQSSRLFRRRWLLIAASAVTVAVGLFAPDVWQVVFFAAAGALAIAYVALLYVWFLRSYRSAKGRERRPNT